MRSKVGMLLLLCLSMALLLLAPMTQLTTGESPPSLKNGRVTPRAGDDQIEYLFTVTYIDVDNQTPVFIQVVIDGKPYDMEAVDPADANTSDGKDYNIKVKLSEGAYPFYFKTSDGHNHTETRVDTFEVQTSSIFRMEHSDLVRVIFMFSPIVFIAILVLLLQLRKIAKTLEDISSGAKEYMAEAQEGSPIVTSDETPIEQGRDQD